MKIVTRKNVQDGIKSLKLLYSGKNGVAFRGTLSDAGSVRVLVRTDDFSAFDVESKQPIPWMGLVLNQMSVWAFSILRVVTKTHLISGDIDDISRMIVERLTDEEKDLLRGRCMLVEEVEICPVEWVPRGNIVGSAWREQLEHGGWVSGIKLPDGLILAQELPETIVTPATKARKGKRDMNIDLATADHVVDVWLSGHHISSPMCGDGRFISDLTAEFEKKTKLCFNRAQEVCLPRGWRILDGKFEFGLQLKNGGIHLIGGRPTVILADEALTPAAGRFVRLEDFVPGQEPKYKDKEIVRRWLQGEFEAGRWNKKAPMPTMSEEIIREISEGYREVFESLTGYKLLIPE